ncbi:MAG: serine/threonine protein kinase [Deltaproteobacteria bacterium]|nr:serine/threonine protein kinase [Deltaproteobacteria bacterium]
MQSAPSHPFPPPGVAPEPESSQEEILPRQFGKYTLLRALASGGMAKVYLAIQRAVAGFEKLVVIKRILPELARDASFVEMLLSEARTAATLNHPNVVQTFDVGEVEGTYYIAMEHINGEDIRSIVRAMKRASVTEFPMEHTLTILLGCCAGLAYAHEKKDLEGNKLDIVHRDISPQNVLITFSGDVKIVDFGIAKSSEAAAGERTTAGQLKGKVPYMSPEQAKGDDVDHRSDIFAVGIMLFELTTGRRLFKAKSEFDTLKLICDREYPKPSQIVPGYPLGLEAIVMRALVKDRDQRYQNARDMQADLENFIRVERIAASAVSLSNWMKMLFQDKIDEQKEALQDVKQLADVIASQRSVIETDMFPGTTTGATTMSGSGTDVGAYTAIRRRKSRRLAIAGALAAVLLVGTGLVVAFMQAGGETQAGPTTTAPPAAPPEPAAPKGKLTVTSDPSGAYVRIAGELQGTKTPTTLEKIPLDMEIEVKVSKEGFEDYVTTVELDPDKLEDTLEVKLLKGSVTLVWKVHPANAQVTVDGKRWKGKANKVEEMSTGAHKVVFAAGGHVPQVVKFTAKKGETKEVDIKLVKGPATSSGGQTGGDDPPQKPKGTGMVSVASRGGFCSNVIIGGKSVGPTPTPPTRVPAGPVGITCKLADGRSVGSGTKVEANKTSRVTITIPK